MTETERAPDPWTAPSAPPAGLLPLAEPVVAGSSMPMERVTSEPIAADPMAAVYPAGERPEWGWVAEWRRSAEPTPWAQGVTLATFSALVIGAAVYVLAAGLADQPLVAVAVNIVVAGGLTPAVWYSRDLPVLRWVGVGAVFGIVAAWIGALLFLAIAPA